LDQLAGPCGWEDYGLPAPESVEMIARPDDPHACRASTPVVAAQVTAHGLEQTAVGRLVPKEGFGQVPTVSQSRCAEAGEEPGGRRSRIEANSAMTAWPMTLSAAAK
jgi:hypothetical protein